MKRLFFLLLTATLVSLPASNISAELFDVKSKKTILDNGLTVIVSEMPTNPMVSVYGLVKTGSAAEGEFLGSGITHFLEHMLFNDTDRFFKISRL